MLLHVYEEVTVSGSLPYVHSEEDTNIKALVSAWLKYLPHTDPSSSSSLEGWIEDYFYQALDWVTKSGELVVNTTQVGVAMNGLSHLVGVASKAEFACALVRGLGGNLPQPTREKFAKEVKRTCLTTPVIQSTSTSTFSPSPPHQVFHMTHEIPPDPRRILDTYYDHTTGRQSTYQLEVPQYSSLMYTYMYVRCSPALSYQTT